MKWCPSCGGVLGVDCFNPEECAWITQSMQEDAQRAEYERAQGAYYKESYEKAMAEGAEPESPDDPRQLPQKG